MIDCIGVVYVETELELSGPIKPSVVCYRSNRVQSMTKTRQDNDMVDPTRVAYVENKIELS